MKNILKLLVVILILSPTLVIAAGIHSIKPVINPIELDDDRYSLSKEYKDDYVYIYLTEKKTKNVHSWRF